MRWNQCAVPCVFQRPLFALLHTPQLTMLSSHFPILYLTRLPKTRSRSLTPPMRCSRTPPPCSTTWWRIPALLPARRCARWRRRGHPLRTAASCAAGRAAWRSTDGSWNGIPAQLGQLWVCHHESWCDCGEVEVMEESERAGGSTRGLAGCFTLRFLDQALACVRGERAAVANRHTCTHGRRLA